MNLEKNFNWLLVGLYLMMSYMVSGQGETEFYSNGIVIPKVSVKAVSYTHLTLPTNREV